MFEAALEQDEEFLGVIVEDGRAERKESLQDIESRQDSSSGGLSEEAPDIGLEFGPSSGILTKNGASNLAEGVSNVLFHGAFGLCEENLEQLSLDVRLGFGGQAGPQVGVSRGRELRQVQPQLRSREVPLRDLVLA